MCVEGGENDWEGFENKRAPYPNSRQCERDGGENQIDQVWLKIPDASDPVSHDIVSIMDHVIVQPWGKQIA
jgi:hypothetical protein